MLSHVFNETVSWAEKNSIPHYAKSSVNSTNDWAKTSLDLCTGPTIFFADTQSAGRGRGSNTWVNSESGTSLLSTWVFPLSTAPQPIASPIFGLGVFRSARAVWPSLEWSLKAPNDLKLGPKKIAGLLLETVQSGSKIHLLAGLGMNVLDHPDSEPHACHLNGEDGLGLSLDQSRWCQFLDQLHSHFFLASEACQKLELNEKSREDLVEALNRNPKREGLVMEVSEHGDLIYDDKTVSWKDL